MYKPPANFPFWTILLIAVTVSIALFSLWHLKIEPIYSLTDVIFSSLSQMGANLAVSLNLGGITGSIGDSIAANPLAFGVTAISGVAAIYSIVGKIRADHLKQQTQEAAAAQLNQMDNYYTTKLAEANTRLDGVAGLETKIGNLETELSSMENYRTQIGELENKLSGKQETIINLQQMLEDFKINTYERVIVK